VTELERGHKIRDTKLRDVPNVDEIAAERNRRIRREPAERLILGRFRRILNK
jgi:hypothetical protein